MTTLSKSWPKTWAKTLEDLIPILICARNSGISSEIANSIPGEGDGVIVEKIAF